MILVLQMKKQTQTVVADTISCPPSNVAPLIFLPNRTLVLLKYPVLSAWQAFQGSHHQPGWEEEETLIHRSQP